ncbi:MAG: methylated-DNA--[protein]-cysteine S-methyltransferase [Bifidobacteriaceae bacterium]|jgi:methylated-DNA-[protein]-cysteine S-methyltransferase|nr:methylated-DNA--[protein]-cysteine S-methyltransferase [Bifidobacteriaceae bacterium]
MHYITSYQSPISALTLLSDGENLVGLWLVGQKHYGAGLLTNAEQKDDLPVFEHAKDWLDRYFAGKKPQIAELPLAPEGSEFRQSVWDILREIPYGSVMTYGDIAKRIAVQTGKTRMSAQAIGGAVGHNPISIIVPCHRVVGANGNLTGYAGGLQYKIKLLELEGVDMGEMFVPKRGTAV